MRLRTRIALGCALLGLTAASAQGPGGGDFTVQKSVIAGGSGAQSGGSFRVQGTLGQREAGSMAGGPFAVAGGFWVDGHASPPPEDRLFGDGFES